MTPGDAWYSAEHNTVHVEVSVTFESLIGLWKLYEHVFWKDREPEARFLSAVHIFLLRYGQS